MRREGAGKEHEDVRYEGNQERAVGQEPSEDSARVSGRDQPSLMLLRGPGQWALGISQ